MRILITGGTGLIGKAFIENRSGKDAIVATYLGTYTMEDYEGVTYVRSDIRDLEGNVRIFREYKPEVVIHTASIGSPDYAETHRKETHDVNITGARNILSICEKVGAKYIYISSNGIYDGDRAPYGEESNAEPVNYYGEVKLKAEMMAREAKVQCAIVRPILIYGWNYAFERSNIVTQTILKLQRGEVMKAYDDVYANPLFNHSCAMAIWEIIRRGKYDVFNIAGADRVSIYQLLRKVAEIFDVDGDLIEPVQQGYFNELVKRPKDTSFRTEKMEKELDLKPLSLDEGLRLMKAMHQ
ncbi:MAG: SDR family oxidoreductase [Syntrophorhabdaceae bacterium]